MIGRSRSAKATSPDATSAEERGANFAKVMLIGSLPPPVNGQAIATRYMADLLAKAGFSINLFPTGYDNKSPGCFGGRFGRHYTALRAIFDGASDLIYVSVNSGLGRIATLVLVAAARFKQRPLVLHHHSLAQIDRWDPIMALITVVAGAGAIHLVQCSEMASRLSLRYRHVRQSVALSNISLVSQAEVPAKARANCIRIGFFSNLSLRKGLGRLLDLQRRLGAIGLQVELVLAGPADKPATNLIKQAQISGQRLRYFGAIYSAAQKTEFFENIDIFACLSYSETQGIVNLEALGAGRTVFSIGHCCIPSDLDSGGGFAVPEGQPYFRSFVKLLSRAERELGLLSVDARLRYEELKIMGKLQEAVVIESFRRELKKNLVYRQQKA